MSVEAKAIARLEAWANQPQKYHDLGRTAALEALKIYDRTTPRQRLTAAIVTSLSLGIGALINHSLPAEAQNMTFASGPVQALPPKLSPKEALKMGSRGIDISFPQCGTEIPTHHEFGIVGVNGGSPFKPNGCLKEQISVFDKYAVYVNSNYPGSRQARARLGTQVGPADNLDQIAYKYGQAVGSYAYGYAKSQGVDANQWWVDVEDENLWAGTISENRQSIQGEIDAIYHLASEDQEEEVHIGIYGHPNFWRKITGNWEIKLPNWVYTGKDGPEVAVSHCSDWDFTKGGTVMVQHEQNGLDHNITC